MMLAGCRARLGAVWLLALALLFGLQGCALSPKDEAVRATSVRLLNQQLDAVDAYLQQQYGPQTGAAQQGSNKRTVLFIGSAQHSQSKAFQGDVLALKAKLEQVNPATQSIVLSNELQTSALQYPFASSGHFNLAMQRAARWSQRYPLTLVLLVATHGNRHVLGVNIAGTDWPHYSPKYLNDVLAPLGNTPTALILSACFSGSFVQPLAASHRIILTAAAEDRASFGCHFHDKNTYFVGQWLSQAWQPDSSWQTVYERTVAAVTQLEKQAKVDQHSNPMASIPPAYASMTLRQFLNQAAPH